MNLKLQHVGFPSVIPFREFEALNTFDFVQIKKILFSTFNLFGLPAFASWDLNETELFFMVVFSLFPWD